MKPGERGQARRGETLRAAQFRLAMAGVSLLALTCSFRPSAADITVTNGTFVVNSSGDLAGNDVIVDNAADAEATLQVNAGALLDNAITLTNGGILDNAGSITRDSGVGVFADTGTVRNHAGGSITGTTGVYGDYPSSGTVDVVNSGTITGTNDAGVDLENGGTITNEAGGKITGVVFGALVWGGTVTNQGPGSSIRATRTDDFSAGIQMADSGSIYNLDGAVIEGYDGIDLFNGGSITNSGGSRISGTAWGIYTADGAATVLNSGEDSKISGAWGVYLTAGGTITNEDGAEISSDDSAAVYLTQGGTVINGAGSRITGDPNGIYGIYGSGETTKVTNAGTITGDVRLSDYFANDVTLISGGKIEGDLYVNTDAGSTLTLDGTGTQLYSTAVTGITTFVRGDLIKQGSGTWIIDKSINAFTMAVDPGTITIKAGTLQVGNGNGGATAGRITANVANDGTLAFNRSDNLTYAGKVSGSGSLVKQGAGTLTLTGSNSYTGGTVIEAGTLQIGGTGGAIIGDVEIETGGTLAFNRTSATAFGFAGVISGDGTVVKKGNNTLTLTGVNSYAGGTRIDSGTLIGSATSFGGGNIVSEGTLVVDQAGRADFANGLSGSGSFIKRGDGVLNYTGDGTIAAAEVAQGTLAVIGRLDATVTIVEDATLAGTGTVGGIVAKSGSITAAGNSIGTLHVADDYAAEAGSLYRVELSGDGRSDRLMIDGAAAIAGGARLEVVRFDDAPFTLGTRYTVLTADDGVTGLYGLTGATRLSAFADIVATYDAENVYLDVAQTRSFAAAARTPNQQAVAGAADDLPDSHPLAGALAFLPDEALARAAFDSLSGEIHASLRSVLIDDSRFPREAALDRLRTDLKSTDVPRQRAFWGHGFGAWSQMEDDGNAASLTRSTGGFLMGLDDAFGDFPVGLLAGFSKADISSNGRRSSASSENHHLGLYGGVQQGPFALRSGFIHTWHAITTKRTVTFAEFSNAPTAEYTAETDQLFGEASWRIDASSARFEPFATLAHLRLATDGYAEDGGAARLTGGSEVTEMTFATAGLRASLETELGAFPVSMKGMVGWRHGLGDMTPRADLAFTGGSDFTVAGLPIERDMAIIETGLEVDVGPAGKLTLSYGGQFGDLATDHSVQGGFYFKF
jgi:outer membrane autotransporter protein